MEGGREQEPRSEDPEESRFGIEALQCHPAHDREHEPRGQVPGRHRAGQNGFEDRERSLVGAPVLGVGGQSGPERRSRRGVGEMEEGQHHRARHRQAHAVPAGEHRQRRDGRELGQGGEGEHRPHRPDGPSTGCGVRTGAAAWTWRADREGIVGGCIVGGCIVGGRIIGSGIVGGRSVHPGPARGEGEKEQSRQQKYAEGLEVSAPGGLDHQQGRPREEDERARYGAPRPAGHLRQQHAGRQVGKRPEELERDHRPARKRARREDHLGERRVDGGDGGIVDARVPGGAHRFEFGRVRRVRVGVDPLQLHVSVPHVAVDVVGQKWNAGE